MNRPIDAASIESIIDKVAKDPAKAREAKRELRDLAGMAEPAQRFTPRPRRQVAEIDDDLFDNMPV